MSLLRPIHNIIIMGDSLSDRQTLSKRLLFGTVPMGDISGLNGRSPRGRFTNGYVWSDHLSAWIAEDLFIRKLREQGLSSADIADDIISGGKIHQELQSAFCLNDDQAVYYKGKHFIRTFCEGGLSAHDYRGDLSAGAPQLAARQLVSTLNDKRNEIIHDDRVRNVSKVDKAQSLIIEWSGANDMITVNAEPTIEAANKAVAARVANIEKMIQQGYANFMLFNLPDLSLTPRYQNQTGKEGIVSRKNAKRVSEHFNDKLLKACRMLNKKYPQIVLNTFDVNSIFKDAYHHPEKYGLTEALRSEPYIQSKDFKVKKDNTSPAPGYMFWDDVHPTAHVHAILARKCYQQIKGKYRLFSAKESLKEQFVRSYQARWNKDVNGIFGFFKNSRIDYRNASLEKILRHALKNGGNRTRDVITKLGWINKQGQLLLDAPELIEAMDKVSNKEQACTVERCAAEIEMKSLGG